MSFGQLAIVKFLIERANEPVNVFEWGSGYSTIHIPLWLEQNNREYTWTSIESDPEWHSYVVKMASAEGIRNLDARLVDFEGKNAKRLAVPEKIRDKYVDEISRTSRHIDLAIVDGRFRRRCTKTARQLQQERRLAVICLMDSNKSYRLADESGSSTGALVETGVYPYRAKFKPVSIWLGFKTPGEMKATMALVQQNIDLGKLMKNAENVHRKRNSLMGRARRKAHRVMHRIFTLYR